MSPTNEQPTSQIHRLPSQPLTQLLSQRPLTPISTSLPDFDHELSGGIVPGQIYEISGVNGTGKTSLAVEICVNALKMNKKVLWVPTLTGIPVDRLEQICDEKDALSNLSTIRLTTLGSLFLFLQSLEDPYGLIIIEDLSILIERSLSILEKREHGSSKTKRERYVHDLIKVISSYCLQKKAACCLFNPVDVVQMSFVETQEYSQVQTPSSDSFVSSQRQHTKKSIIYQPILFSALGDHPSWGSLIRSRILLYRDWTFDSKVGTFAHIKYNPMMQKILKYRNHVTRSVSFEITEDGVKPLNFREPTTTQSFTLTDGDLFSSDIEEEEEPNNTTDLNSSTLLVSSPMRHTDIQRAKDVLSSETLRLHQIPVVEDSSVKKSNNESSGEEISIERDTDQENEEELVATTENEHQDTTVTEDIENSPLIESDLPLEVSFRESEEPQTQSDGESDKILENGHGKLKEYTNDYIEIDDELEELFPTQPESLNMVHLSQLIQKRNSSGHKRPKLSHNFAQDLYRDETLSQEDHIPASEPYF